MSHELDVFAKAQEAFARYRHTPSHQKSKLLRKLADALLDDQENLARLITTECKKPIALALTEVERTAQTFLIAAEEARRLPSEYLSLDWTPAGEGKEALVKHVPIGVVLGFTPFNFPFNLVAHKVAPALAAGCGIVIKPSPRTVNCARKLEQMALACGLPEGVFHVLDVPNHEAAGLLDAPQVRMLSFTGSAAVGWTLKQAAGSKKVALELGGNAAVIVTPSADYDSALRKCLAAGFVYSGQVCIHTQRIYLHESLFGRFLQDFVAGAEQLRAGDLFDSRTQLAELIDEAAARRVEQWLAEAVAAGAKLLCGGKRDGAFIAPAVLTNTNEQMKVNCEEVFGPVVAIEPYADFNEVLKAVNRSRYGLQAGLFTDSEREIQTAYRDLEVGGLIINDAPTFRADHMPYGGVKNSGFGREGVKYAILEMTEPRLLVRSTR